MYQFLCAVKKRQRAPGFRNAQFHSCANPVPYMVLQTLAVGGLLGRARQGAAPPENPDCMTIADLAIVQSREPEPPVPIAVNA